MSLEVDMKDNIKKYLLKDFIKEYKRVPLRSELLQMYNSLIFKYPDIENVGLAGSNIKKDDERFFFNAGVESKSAIVKKSLEEAMLDLETLDKEYSSLAKHQKEEYIDQGRIFKNIEEKINNLTKRVNLEVLLRGKQDIFSYGIVENFSSRDKINTERSTVRVLDNNKVTLSYLKSEERKIDIRELDFEIVHLRGNQLAFNRFGQLKNVLEEDEKYFQVESGSDIEDDIVEFIFNITFKSPKNVEQLKYKLQAIQNNSKLQEEVYFSVNGVDYHQLEEAGAVNSETNYIDFNNEDILYKKIILKFRKTAFDYKKEGKFFYSLSFDYLSFVENTYRENSEGVLFLGPYDILDENNRPVNYSLATIKSGTCCIIPNETSVNFYVSKNGETYFKCGFSNESSDVVSLDDKTNNNLLVDFNIVDINSTSEFLVDDNALINYDFESNDRALNIVLKSENQSKVNFETLKVYRNVLTKNKINNGDFYSGWQKEGNKYKCEVIIESSATVDFGMRNLTVDGKEQAGKVFLSQGLHKFEISNRYFYQDFNENTFLKERGLARGDQYYPYNHKYLIEGFQYNRKFRGSKRYRKLGYLYASKLKELNADSFESGASYDSMKTITVNGDKYILIKDINGNGRFEEYDINYQNASMDENSNKLFIKAVLKSETRKVSPKIDQIQVRVI
jgi:hypothetical protein